MCSCDGLSSDRRSSLGANSSSIEKMRSCMKIEACNRGCICCMRAAAIKYQPILTTSTGSLVCFVTRRSRSVVYEGFKGLYQRLCSCADDKSAKQSVFDRYPHGMQQGGTAMMTMMSPYALPGIQLIAISGSLLGIVRLQVQVKSIIYRRLKFLTNRTCWQFLRLLNCHTHKLSRCGISTFHWCRSASRETTFNFRYL